MKKVDLFRKDDKTITFYFLENKAYVEYFEVKGEKKEKTGYSYSSSNTFWVTLVMISMINIAGLIMDKFVIINPVIGSFLSIVSMFTLGKMLINYFKSMIIVKRKENVTFEDIESVLQKSVKGYWFLYLVNCLITAFLILSTTLSIYRNQMSGKDFIMTSLLVLVIAFIQGTIQPNLVIKARKILKRQMKLGVFG